MKSQRAREGLVQRRVLQWKRFAVYSILLCLAFVKVSKPADANVASSDAAGSSPKLYLKVICSSSLFRGVDRAEMVSSAHVWLQNIGAHNGLIVDSQVDLADTVEAMRKRVDEGSVDLVVSSTLEYLAVNRIETLRPAMTMTPTREGTGKIKYLLLVNRDSNVSRAEELRGKRLITYSRSDANLSQLWLDVMLKQQHLGPAQEFFSSVSPAAKPSGACLPLFFGKADACLVDDPSWDVLRELNPQLESKLKVVAESPALLESLVSIHMNRKEYRSDVLRDMLELQDSAAGRQILLFFKGERAAPVTYSDLNEVAGLLSSYLKLTPVADRKLAAIIKAVPTLPQAANGGAPPSRAH